EGRRIVRTKSKLLEHLLRALLEERVQDVVLVLEVVVHGADCRARSRRDVLDARAVEAPLGEDGLGGVEDRVAEEGAGLVPPARLALRRAIHEVNRRSTIARWQDRRALALQVLQPAAAGVDPREPEVVIRRGHESEIARTRSRGD